MRRKIRSYRQVVKRLEAVARNETGLQLKRLGKIKSNPADYDLYLIRSQKAPRFFRRRICLCAGIHGDEPAGVEAILTLIEDRRRLREILDELHLTIFPCINPYGFEHNTRTNGLGLDLNRQFRSRRPPVEVSLVKQAIGRTCYDLAMEFHEDVDTNGFYLYELTAGKEPAWGPLIVEKVGLHWPVNRGEEIEGMKSKNGVIHRKNQNGSFRQLMQTRPDWPQAFYFFSHGTRHCFTTETPVTLDIKDRAKIHLTALEVSLRQLTLS
ncbi:MAG TPA: M14 family metallocarboxypeptidase [Nitrospiria bacterium]|jgi:protein MpaA|nr:M14 family metallocarboxypeptidase [Nitrospiria bacterium]